VPCHAHAATAAPTTFKKRLEQLFQQQQIYRNDVHAAVRTRAGSMRLISW
jgi:hypothetical protein